MDLSRVVGRVQIPSIIAVYSLILNHSLGLPFVVAKLRVCSRAMLRPRKEFLSDLLLPAGYFQLARPDTGSFETVCSEVSGDSHAALSVRQPEIHVQRTRCLCASALLRVKASVAISFVGGIGGLPVGILEISCSHLFVPRPTTQQEALEAKHVHYSDKDKV
jgi:hypothetical protein